MYKNSENLQNTINEWEAERRSLIIEEQEILKATKTFFDCSNFSYDGENLVIEPNIAFKAVIKNSLNKKKLPTSYDIGKLYTRIISQNYRFQ